MMKSANPSKGAALSPYFARTAFASATTRAASFLLPSRPSNFTYVVLSEFSSLPAVFPSSADVAVTSRISSATIINTRFTQLTYV